MLGLQGKEARWITEKYSSCLSRNLRRLGLGLLGIFRGLGMSATCPVKADEENYPILQAANPTILMEANPTEIIAFVSNNLK